MVLKGTILINHACGTLTVDKESAGSEIRILCLGGCSSCIGCLGLVSRCEARLDTNKISAVHYSTTVFHQTRYGITANEIL